MPAVPSLGGSTTLEGRRGVTADGGIWAIDRGRVTQQLPTPSADGSSRGTL
ncbi:hypothetical protein [Streptomyces sp. NPDC054765]